MNPLILPFSDGYQAPAEALIRRGLAERWGTDNPALNQDLRDIGNTYCTGAFFIMVAGGEVIATGGFLPEPNPGKYPSARISRMSVDKQYRQQGLGRQMLRHLERVCRSHGYTEIVLETTATWADAIAFYQRCGYNQVDVREGDAHFSRLLPEPWLHGQVVLFDGDCGLCHRAVRFIVRHDRDEQFRFLSQQSPLGTAVMIDHNMNTETRNTLVLLDNGVASSQSSAALSIAARLNAPWSWLAGLRLLPQAFRDGVYQFIGRRRYRWFGRRDYCELQPELDTARLLE